MHKFERCISSTYIGKKCLGILSAKAELIVPDTCSFEEIVSNCRKVSCCFILSSISNDIYFLVLLTVLKKIGGHKSFSWGQCFGLLVMPCLGFKNQGGSFLHAFLLV